MTTTAVVMNLRVANRDDFADQIGNRKLGVLYFQQSIDESFCTQPYYFSNETNMETFRQLFRSKQIWVPEGIFDRVDLVTAQTQEV